MISCIHPGWLYRFIQRDIQTYHNECVLYISTIAKKMHIELGKLGNETSQDWEHQQLALATFGGDCPWVQRCQRKHMRMEMCQQHVWEKIISMRKQVLQAPSRSNSILWDGEIIIVCAQTLESCHCSGGTLSCYRVSSSWANFDYLWPLLTTVLRLSSLRLLKCMIVC